MSSVARSADVVANRINAHLPSDYRKGLEEEHRRMTGDVLAPLGMQARKILIIGGGGYVGSVLTDHFLATGYEVRSFDNLLYNQGLTIVPFLNHENYEFQHGDLTVESDVEKALGGVTDVILLAGLVGDPVTKKHPDAAKRINDDAHDSLVRTLNGRGLNKVVFVSTCSNYGLIEGDTLADEAFELKPLSLYAKSKVRIEKELLRLKGQTDYNPTVLRFATAFGLSPRMRFDLTVSEFTRAMALGEELLVYDANTWRPYCHLRDFAELIRRVLEAPLERVAFEVFNAGGDKNNFTKQMIVDAILAQLPDGRVRYQEHGQDPRNYRVDFSKVRGRLLFEPRFSVSDGISELIAAMRQGLFHDLSHTNTFYGNWDVNLSS